MAAVETEVEYELAEIHIRTDSGLIRIWTLEEVERTRRAAVVVGATIRAASRENEGLRFASRSAQNAASASGHVTPYAP